MNWHNFIFSEKKPHRFRRHLAFWLLWGIYFSVSFFHYQQTGVEKIEFEIWSFPFFIKVILLLLIHISACYFFIDYLMSKFLFNAKYPAFIIGTVLLSFLIVLSSYCIYKFAFPLINEAFNYKPTIDSPDIMWASIASGLLTAPKIICAAAAIRLLKRWYLKQKEKERLEKEKLVTDLQLLKLQMHPEFLFSSLDNVYQFTMTKNTDKASTLLLKLADILSYLLYECDSNLVLLDKEIKLIKDYLVLQKTRMGDQLEIDIAIKGYPSDKMIAPLLLFSFIENSFLYIDNKTTERNWINLDIQIEKRELALKLIHGKPIESVKISPDENLIEKTMKRLDFFYKGNYELKITEEEEIMMTSLKIVVEQPFAKSENSIYTSERLIYAAN